MVVKKPVAKASGLEIIVSAVPGETGLPQRIASLRTAVARAGLKADLALFSDSLPKGLSGLRHIPAPAGHGSQAALLLAAEGSSARHLLFLPSTKTPDAAALRDLTKLQESFDWVLAPRFAVPFPAGLLQKAGGLRVPLDLGAPCIVSRKSLAKLATGLAPGEAFIAARLMRAAEAADLNVGLMDEGQAAPNLLESLGLDRDLLVARLKSRTDGLLIGAAMIAIGLWLQQVPVLALPLFGFGFLVSGYFFGKSK